MWGLKWGLFAWLQTLVNSCFQRDSNYENLQRRNGPSASGASPRDLRRFSRLSDHTTYMQTSTVMNLVCVSVCVCVACVCVHMFDSRYIVLPHSAPLSSPRCSRSAFCTPPPNYTLGKVSHKGFSIS